MYKGNKSCVSAHWYPHHLSTQGWHMRKELDITSISPWGDLGKPCYLSEFQYPHLVNKRIGFKKKCSMEIPLGFPEGKGRGSYFLGPSSRLHCTKFQLGQLDFSLIFFFFKHWNQCTESRVYDSLPAMVYFHHDITPDVFLSDFFPFLPSLLSCFWQ